MNSSFFLSFFSSFIRCQDYFEYFEKASQIYSTFDKTVQLFILICKRYNSENFTRLAEHFGSIYSDEISLYHINLMEELNDPRSRNFNKIIDPPYIDELSSMPTWRSLKYLRKYLSLKKRGAFARSILTFHPRFSPWMSGIFL